MRATIRITLGLYLLLFLVLNLYLLDQHPPVNVDEPWLSDAALNFTNTGHFSPTMFHGMHYNLEGEYRWWLYQLPLAAIFKVFGFGVYQARFLSFLSGVAALAFLFLLGRQLYSWRVGALAAVLYAFSPIYMAGRIARPEMLLAAFTLAALYMCWQGLQRNSAIFYSLSGLIALLGCDVHLNGIAALSTAGLICLTHPETFSLKKRAVGFYLSGILVGVAYWLIVHGPILTELTAEGLVPFISSWGFIKLKLRTFGNFFHGGTLHYISITSSLMLAAIVGLAIRRRPADKFLLTCIVSYIPFYLLLFVNDLPGYLAYFFPLLFLALAAFVFDLLEDMFETGAQAFTKPKSIAGLAMLIILLGISLGKGAAEIRQGLQYRNTGGYSELIRKLKRHIPADAVVMGQPTWFYGFYKQPYYADRYFAWIARTPIAEVREKLGRTFKDAINQAGVQYIIVDDQMYHRMMTSKAINSLPADEVKAFLAERCILVGEVDDPFYQFMKGQPQVAKIYKVKSPTELVLSPSSGTDSQSLPRETASPSKHSSK